MAPKSRSGWGRSRSFGRQAGDLHHRAGSRIGGDRDDDARRQARQHLCHPGKKHWITGGGVSKLHLIFARVFDERGEEQGIGGFLALGGTPGLIIGKREPAMGLRGIPETEIIFENLEIPEDMLVLPPRGLRRGFADLIDAYNSQRVGAGTSRSDWRRARLRRP
jgi:alkylation response protein AidB-like acyl-CoA dehydrogenase